MPTNPAWIARVPADELPENTLAMPTVGGLAVHQDHITADLAEAVNKHLSAHSDNPADWDQLTAAQRDGYRLALDHVSRGLLDPPRPTNS